MWVSLGNVYAQVTKASPQELAFLRKYLSFDKPGANFSQAYKAGHWDGKVHLFNPRSQTFPAGLLALVQKTAERLGMKVELRDLRTPGVVDTSKVAAWLDPVREQPQALAACLAHGRGVVWAPTGCLTGEAKLVINRGGAARAFELRAVVGRLQGHATRNRAGRLCSWDLSIPTFAQSLDDEGFVRLNRVEQVHVNGRKPVFELVLESGRSLRATDAHGFLTADGEWQPLGKLRPGDAIMVAVWPKAFARQLRRKPLYRQVGRMDGHPYAQQTFSARDGRLMRVPYHRLVAEAHENKMSLYELVGRIHLGDVAGLTFLGPEWHVHHRDGDVLNNELENLEVLSAHEHQRKHGTEGGWKHVAGRAEPEKIVRIDDDGEDDVFDLSMADPLHNYVANEIVTHNSGKTEVFSALGHVVRGSWLVVVNSKDLLHQSAERFEKRTGERAGRIGDGIWEPRRFTVATFQTLHAQRKEERTIEFLRGIEGVISDECHVLPADTFGAVMRMLTGAYWRIGFSGTPLAKDDARNMQLVGMTGPVIYRVKAAALVDAGVLSKPKIRFVTLGQVVPGQTWGDVYRAGIVESQARNQLVCDIVAKAAKPALVFIKQIDHGRILAKMLAGRVRLEYVFGEDSTEERRAAIKRLQRGDLDVLIASSIFDVGVDIPELRSVVIAAGGKDIRTAIQRLGRGMRVTSDKQEVELWDIQDKGTRWLAEHAEERLSTYAREGFEVVVVAGAAELALL